MCLYLSVSYIRISIHSSLYSCNKQITSWLVRLYDIIIHSLWRIAKLTRSLRSLVRLTILHNSWIKIVRTHQPWGNLYVFNNTFFFLQARAVPRNQIKDSSTHLLQCCVLIFLQLRLMVNCRYNSLRHISFPSPNCKLCAGLFISITLRANLIALNKF